MSRYIYVDDDVFENIAAYSRAAGVKMRDSVRLMVDFYLARSGVLEDSPCDMSAKHS